MKPNIFKNKNFIGIFLFSIIFACTFFDINKVRAEQSGSSPESGVSSRLFTASSSASVLNYGSTAAGTWGNWLSFWNRIYSAAIKPFNDAIAKGLKNGGNADYPQSVGGVDDYNGGSSPPADSYVATWTTCNAGNNYCGTGRAVAEKQDNNTGLIWSPTSASSTWFVANNCKYPNGLVGDDGVCNTNGEIACKCVKLTSSKTGCEAYDDGNWRLPTQKELMMSYIDGSYSNLTTPSANFWSSTTTSPNTNSAWNVAQGSGYTNYFNKTNNYSVRCVR